MSDTTPTPSTPATRKGKKGKASTEQTPAGATPTQAASPVENNGADEETTGRADRRVFDSADEARAAGPKLATARLFAVTDPAGGVVYT
jgi:hypothetical protein